MSTARTLAKISTLQKESIFPSISLYLPLGIGRRSLGSNTIKLKNALRGIRKSSSEFSKKQQSEIASLLNEVFDQIVQQSSFENCQAKTIVVFVSPNHTAIFYLPMTLKHQHFVGLEFVPYPAIDILRANNTYNILSLSQGGARLFEATEIGIHEITPKKMPSNLKDSLGLDEISPQIQSHSVSMGGFGGSEGFHGHGGLKDAKQDLVVAYFRKIDSAVKPKLNHSHNPLIIIGVEYLLPIYNRISSMPTLTHPSLHGNFEKATAEEIHRSVLTHIRAPAVA